jgi:tRNA-Thr(GGU) m(6)t(6)A37 methyltransferase TsaA
MSTESAGSAVKGWGWNAVEQWRVKQFIGFDRTDGGDTVETVARIEFKPVGRIRTPYTTTAPYQPVESVDAAFWIELDHAYVDGLDRLQEFRYIYVIYHAHRVARAADMVVSPPWAEGKRVGVFASRSPVRPNPIGLSVVRVMNIAGNRIRTSGLDVFDGTPLLDIKPYIRDLDTKQDANYGWVEEMDDFEHLALHIRGIPHDYSPT